MPNLSAPFRIWSYCRSATLRPKLIEARCEVLEEPPSDEAEVREVTNNGLKVMFLPGYVVRVARGEAETEEAARARIYATVRAAELEQDKREQADAERKADTELSKVLNHAIKVLWVLERPNASDGEVVTLELRRPSPREKRLFADEAGTVSAYEAAEVSESGDAHVKYRVTARLQ
jgi:hypothetical protein